MAISTVIKNLWDGSITLADGTGTPVTLTVPCSVGDFKVDGLDATAREVKAYETRGTLNSLRRGERRYSNVSFSVHFREFTNSSAGVVLDFIRFANGYSANISTRGGSTADVKTIKVTLTIEGTDLGDGKDHTIVLPDCHLMAEFAEGDPNTLVVSGICYGDVSFT